MRYRHVRHDLRERLRHGKRPYQPLAVVPNPTEGWGRQNAIWTLGQFAEIHAPQGLTHSGSVLGGMQSMYQTSASLVADPQPATDKRQDDGQGSRATQG